MIKQGWQDDKDLLQWNLEINAISGDLKSGVSAIIGGGVWLQTRDVECDK